MKNKKGFTLIELLAVIVILAIVSLIATPAVLNVVEEAKKNSGQSDANMILRGIESYCDTEMTDSNELCTNGITKDEVKQMVNLGKAEILEIEYSEQLDWLKVEIDGNIYGLDNGKMVLGFDSKPTLKPNAPILLDKLTPIVYDGTNWIYADINKEWYNYDKKQWANAVVLNTTKNPGDIITEDDIDLWYVWIPRFKYKIFSDGINRTPEQAIEIVFEQGAVSTGGFKCVDSIKGSENNESEVCYKIENGKTDTTKTYSPTSTDYYTHPAFTYGTTELTGIWVGKFESSADIINGSLKKILIKPNVPTLTNRTIAEFYKLLRKVEIDYSINGNTHMMKNMEWGAVAYLAQSNYGLCTNNVCTDIARNNYYDSNQRLLKTGYAAVKAATIGYSETSVFENEFGIDSSITKPYNTDVGVKASTTQNIYGIYDMSGGAAEYTMGNSVNAGGNFNAPYSSEFNEPDPEWHYSGNLDTIDYDKYSFNSSATEYKRGKLGDSTKEILGWTKDHNSFITNELPWFVRGGSYDNGNLTGIFMFYGITGRPGVVGSARGVLVTR